MYIAETTPERKNIEFANGGTFSSGNVILHWWYSKILTTGNKADTIAICLLSDQDAPTMFDGVWGRIRQSLIDYYGSGGNAMDSAWFAKLKADVDPDAKKLTLKAPTKFIKEWVQSNYAHLIDKLCCLHNYSLEGVFAV